jgi:hypothetical protein
MRHNAKRSSRGKQQKKPNRMKVYYSNGPDVRIRGTAWQVTEKYDALAKDAETSGNYVLAENYRQHAEHYQRIINSFANETPVSADGNKDVNTNEKSSVNAEMISKQKEREMAAA